MALIDRLKHLPIITAAKARQHGVHPALLAHYVNTGRLERVSRGVYRNPTAELNVDFQWEDLVIAATSIPDGVVCLISALLYYELTEEIAREHWIAVPHAKTAPRRAGCKIVRMRNMTVGRTTTKIGDTQIAIFDRERTLVDAFRYLSIEVAIKAMKTAFANESQTKPSIVKLQKYAKLLRVRIEEYLIAVTT